MTPFGDQLRYLLFGETFLNIRLNKTTVQFTSVYVNLKHTVWLTFTTYSRPILSYFTLYFIYILSLLETNVFLSIDFLFKTGNIKTEN